MIFAQLSHALSLNDICDCLKFHKGYLAQVRDCTPPSRNGLAHANANRDAALAEELFWTVLSDLIKLVEVKENENSPPVKLTAVQMQFDFGNI